MAELLEKVHAITALEDHVHWFCSNPSTETTRNKDVASKAAGPYCELAFAAFMVFAYTTERTENYRRQLSRGIDRNLTRCDACIFHYYRGKHRLLTHLRNEYASLLPHTRQ
jgi:hypothetical protein